MINYTPKSKQERFYAAVQSLENFLSDYKSPYKWKLGEKTTNNFEKMKLEVETSGTLTISKEGCEMTIYSKRKFNYIARLWHDTIHLQNNLDFSLKDETKVGQIQIDEFEKWAMLNGAHPCSIEDVKEILYHDIIDQRYMYDVTKEFVEDQRAFVYNQFLSQSISLKNH